MQISVKAHRSLITSENTIEDIEMCISDFVRRDDDHRPALAAMHAELQQALDHAELDLWRKAGEPIPGVPAGQGRQPPGAVWNEIDEANRLFDERVASEIDDEAALEAQAAAGQGSR